jgi:hypothetical protein
MVGIHCLNVQCCENLKSHTVYFMLYVRSLVYFECIHCFYSVFIKYSISLFHIRVVFENCTFINLCHSCSVLRTNIVNSMEYHNSQLNRLVYW